MKIERKAKNGRDVSPTARRRRVAGVAGVLAGVAVSAVVSASPAAAYPWDPHVVVVGSTSTCVPNGGGWMWYDTSDGDHGWGQLAYGTMFTLPLSHVSTSGSIITLKWGVGNCTQKRYFVVHRPAYGNNAAVGNLG